MCQLCEFVNYDQYAVDMTRIEQPFYASSIIGRGWSKLGDLVL
jgi:hypothetical protein